MIKAIRNFFFQRKLAKLEHDQWREINAFSSRITGHNHYIGAKKVLPMTGVQKSELTVDLDVEYKTMLWDHERARKALIAKYKQK